MAGFNELCKKLNFMAVIIFIFYFLKLFSQPLIVSETMLVLKSEWLTSDKQNST